MTNLIWLIGFIIGFIIITYYIGKSKPLTIMDFCVMILLSAAVWPMILIVWVAIKLIDRELNVNK